MRESMCGVPVPFINKGVMNFEMPGEFNKEIGDSTPHSDH